MASCRRTVSASARNSSPRRRRARRVDQPQREAEHALGELLIQQGAFRRRFRRIRPPVARAHDRSAERTVAHKKGDIQWKDPRGGRLIARKAVPAVLRR